MAHFRIHKQRDDTFGRMGEGEQEREVEGKIRRAGIQAG